MAISDVSICNSALIKLGVERISLLTETNKRARICNEQFAKTRNEVLTAHPWNFAIKRVELASLSTAPIFGYTYQYQLPTDCLRVLEVQEKDIKWAIEGRKLLSDDSIIKIKYIAEITDASEFSPNFAETLSYKLAADLAYTLKLSDTLAQRMESKYLTVLRDSRSADAQEGTPPNLISDDFLSSRI